MPAAKPQKYANPFAPLSHLGDIPIETFIAEYWHKKPLLIRQAFADFQPPIAPDELAGLACEDEVESRLIIEDPEQGNWQLRQGPFAESDFAALPDSHWTLLVQAVDHWVPEAADLLQRFHFIPGWRLDDLMISYATRGGGVGPHYDNYDVFLLQVEGQRRWEIGGYYDEHSAIEPDKPVRILQDWQPQQSWLLEPGDMLYLPPQVGHNGVAESDACVTYSIGYRAPQYGDMLMGFADYCSHRLMDIDRYSDPDLSLRRSSGEICRSDLERVRSVFRRFVEDEELLADWFGRLVTEAKYPDYSPLQGGLVMAGAEQQTSTQASDIAQLLTAEPAAANAQQQWRRAEGVRLAYWQGNGGIKLFTDAEVTECSPPLQALVSLLCDQSEYPLGQLQQLVQRLPAENRSEALTLLSTLVANEVLYSLQDV